MLTKTEIHKTLDSPVSNKGRLYQARNDKRHKIYVILYRLIIAYWSLFGIWDLVIETCVIDRFSDKF
jgi:hypothetical protein